MRFRIPDIEYETWVSDRHPTENVRVINHAEECVGFKLNLIGVRVYRRYCQLVGRSGDGWEPIGAPRDLPVELPDDPALIGSDPLLLTIFQYDQERPHSDLLELLAQRKSLDSALAERV